MLFMRTWMQIKEEVETEAQKLREEFPNDGQETSSVLRAASDFCSLPEPNGDNQSIAREQASTQLLAGIHRKH